ncbi:GGDEF domain-containing protein [Actinoplanes sandaracinus]
MNRRGFFEVATAATLDAVRQGGTVAVIAADLDHFKALNDVYGHAAGDEALRNFGAVLRRGRRTGDEAGRLGGEEFCPRPGDRATGPIAEETVSSEPGRRSSQGAAGRAHSGQPRSTHAGVRLG